ncbi:MAG: methyltransferase domain-containing protein [Deltaproteobacteria bacterium]|nr:methyltransferase domain-containing protein [Deltaproteobacteria bacterium]
MTFADHYSTVAAQYAAYRPHYPAALVDVLADRSPPGTALDVGCGSGQLSVALAARFTRVIATDPAQAQLDAARPAPGVEYRCAPAEASGLPAASIALVVAAQAAHWFDMPRFLAEVERIAVPGALIALVSYGVLHVEGADADTVIQRYYSDDAGPYWPKERAHVETGYRDLVLPWPAVEAPPLEMSASWTRDELVGYLTTWSATVKMIAARGTGPLDAVDRALRATWSDAKRRTIRWPLTVKLARRA